MYLFPPRSRLRRSLGWPQKKRGRFNPCLRPLPTPSSRPAAGVRPLPVGLPPLPRITHVHHRFYDRNGKRIPPTSGVGFRADRTRPVVGRVVPGERPARGVSRSGMTPADAKSGSPVVLQLPSRPGANDGLLAGILGFVLGPGRWAVCWCGALGVLGVESLTLPSIASLFLLPCVTAFGRAERGFSRVSVP
jgi:hypothetical protein